MGKKKEYCLTLTLACHSHNGFGVAGGACFSSEREWSEHWESIAQDDNNGFDMNGDQFSFVVDKNNPEDIYERFDEKQVSKETASIIMGKPYERLVLDALDNLRQVQPMSFDSDSSYKARS